MKVQGPDGQIFDFPDGMPDAVVHQEMMKRYSGGSAAGEPPQQLPYSVPGQGAPQQQPPQQPPGRLDRQIQMLPALNMMDKNYGQAIEKLPEFQARVAGAKKDAEHASDRASKIVDSSLGSNRLQAQTGYLLNLIDQAKKFSDEKGIPLFGPNAGADWMIKARSMGAAPADYNAAGALQQKLHMGFNQLAADWAKGEFPSRITNANLVLAQSIKPNLMMENPGLAYEGVARMHALAEAERIRHEMLITHGLQAAEDPRGDFYKDALLGRRVGQAWNPKQSATPAPASQLQFSPQAGEFQVPPPKGAPKRQRFDPISGQIVPVE